MADKLNLGHCGVCETKIWDMINNKMVPNVEYSEINFMLSDGTLATHAVCSKDASDLTDEKIDLLLERIKATWYDEMTGTAEEHDFERVKKLKVETYDIDPKKAEEKYKEKKKKEKEEEDKKIK